MPALMWSCGLAKIIEGMRLQRPPPRACAVQVHGKGMHRSVLAGHKLCHRQDIGKERNLNGFCPPVFDRASSRGG